MRKLFSILIVFSALSAFAERPPFERYRSIVDRHMFGPPPPGFDPTKLPSEVRKVSSKEEAELTKEQEAIKKAIRFSVLNVNAAGEPMVGFTDSADPKNPIHYYLKVGESQRDWTVLEADPQEATMTIQNKDGMELTLKLGGDSAGTQDAEAKGEGKAMPQLRTGAASVFGGGASLRERRRLQEEQMRAENAKREEADKLREKREAEARAERAELQGQLERVLEEQRRAREAREREAAEIEVQL